ncbi:GNAT family N-acetyltransferase [Chryseobacterium sp.]|uniref:GNAT family N-acetyltransferase n=1 Tax=Chryseobacterium sp. TaxID=1871047 RepID=UPI00289D1952|nr:GNAT family N-acetyltransferase [Chryseobacterium sp.]
MLDFKIAERKHLADIVKLLADDELGKDRENFELPLSQKYIDAFEKIRKDENQELIVVLNDSEEVVGTLQLSFLQYLTYQGGIRAQIEAVRIRREDRGKGYGTLFFTWAIEKAKECGAHLLQLTSDKKRSEAIGFHEKLGFTASHEGMKLHFK